MPRFLLGKLAKPLHPCPMAANTMIEQQLPFVESDNSSDWKNIDEQITAVEERGEVMKAKKIAATAVLRARDAENGNSDKSDQLLHCLECRANLFHRQGDYGSAKDDYLEAISLVAGKSGQEGTVGRLYGSLGYLFESTGEEDQAVDAYERALEQLGRLREPEVIDEVRLTNNLAFIYSARDDFDEAETLFLKALKLAHEKLGEADPDSTGVFNNIGALYQKAGHLEQAREMHKMALQGREKDGSSSADIAQSHGNLAIVFAEEGDEEKSREHFEAALKGYQSAGVEYADDYDAVCSNYRQLLRNVGDQKNEKRVDDLLAKGLS